jgi:hypothetical protein
VPGRFEVKQRRAERLKTDLRLSKININGFKHLGPNSLALAEQLDGTLALCIKTRWNFGLMGCPTSGLWGLRIRK